MPDWIEFKCIKNDGTWDGPNTSVEPVSIRVYSIAAIAKSSSDSCVISIDNEKGSYYSVAESYEDIMAKIKQIEEPVTVPVAEHFTQDEYRLILETMERLDRPSESAQNIVNVLKEILKEND